MSNKKGFTMVELLVVLIIVAILAAIATPIYLANTRRARVSEAIATMSLIRQALRDYHVNHNLYFDIASGTEGNIQNGLPATVDATTGAPSTPNDAGVVVDAGVARYFSNHAFKVETLQGLDTNGASDKFVSPNVVDFLITATGDNSDQCTSDTDNNCATHYTDVAGYGVEMDNSGRIFVCYGTCGTAGNWSAY